MGPALGVELIWVGESGRVVKGPGRLIIGVRGAFWGGGQGAGADIRILRWGGGVKARSSKRQVRGEFHTDQGDPCQKGQVSIYFSMTPNPRMDASPTQAIARTSKRRFALSGADPGFFKRGGSILGLQANKGGPGGGPTLGPTLKSLYRAPKRGSGPPAPPPPITQLWVYIVNYILITKGHEEVIKLQSPRYQLYQVTSTQYCRPYSRGGGGLYASQ